MIHLTCECGEVYHADESQVGRAIRCPRCGRVLRIEAPAPLRPSSRPTTHAKPRYNSPAPVKRASGTKWGVVALGAVVLVIALLATRTASKPPATSTRQPGGPLPSDGARPTGTELWPVERSGLGELVVENGTEFDALVKLVNPQSMRTERLVFVRKGETAQIKGIAPATYILRYALGF